jgi:uncharacterized protein (DUF2237 family)
VSDATTPHEAVNVLGEALAPCSERPLTGYFRDGYCNTCDQDAGSHTVCVQATRAFLDYSARRGNDLATPMPEYGFEGLRPGDSWCLCAARWWQAYQDGVAPRVHLSRTHRRALEIIPLEVLRKFAVDLN